MLERAPQQEQQAEARLVAFRGAGFAPRASRHAGWIALLVRHRGLASRRQRGPGQFAVPADAVGDHARDLAARRLSGALWQHISYSI